jgi:hypothetical protein
MPALTGDVTTSAGAVATAIANDAVTNAKLANMANATVKGRTTAGTGDPEDLTAAQFMAFVGAPNVQVFTTGSGNWSKPAGARFVQVECVGGGGAGGGTAAVSAAGGARGGGGGGGGYARKVFAASALGATEAYVVGAGGTPGAAGANNGGDGGDTTFSTAGNQVKGGKGLGGSGCAQQAGASRVFISTGGAGGVGTGGDFNCQGGDGGGAKTSTSGHCHGGGGGNSALGGVAVTNTLAAQGAAGHAYGGGGDGPDGETATTTAALQGGAGGSGIVIVTTYF